MRSRKALETENSKLKKLLAETMLDKAMLTDDDSERWLPRRPAFDPLEKQALTPQYFEIYIATLVYPPLSS